jgi:hypothetical protein
MPRDYCDPKLMRVRVQLAHARKKSLWATVDEQPAESKIGRGTALEKLGRSQPDPSPQSSFLGGSPTENWGGTIGAPSGEPLTPLAYRQATGASNLRSTLQHRR